MGLGASLYSGISGLTVHSERMTVIGNNLANVNTTGFKGAMMQFEDLASGDFATVNGIGQVGRGVRVSTIYTDWGQGAFESSTEATDMAISGDGLFVVSPLGEDGRYFTRAGNFRFDQDGYLVDPHGYVLQGWEIERTSTSVTTTSANTTESPNSARIIGTPTNIRMENFQSEPNPTTSVTIVTNLDPTSADKSTSTTNPYFAMFNNWDGSAETPLPSTSYGYSTTLKVYDDIGTAHNLTVYFDKVTLSNAGGDTVWEYMVTCEPNADRRTLSGANGLQTSIGQGGTSAAGVLMIGTLTFSTGQLSGMSAYTLKSNGGANIKDLSNWSLADFSTSGYPVCTPNFLGKSNASTAEASAATPIQIDFGIRNSDLSSNGGGAVTIGWSGGLGTLPTTASMVGNNIGNTGYLANYKDPAVSALATQSYDTGGSSTLFQSQNGYSAGILQNISVSREGIISGHYSNGQVLELYAVTLATFTNEHGLRREGGNLFTETLESGPALTGQAGSTGKGTIDGNALEISNVDMATEFVRMITTQRGFQANTKVITTVDSMLGEVIAMKR
ncbi:MULTISPECIES: flagellar hook-basal body complex protein [unclassified Pseudodesulfovibrio]|uniref:flagellar hook protein FlgE n=1 Tax=unclassified Pseudodesulfovibrio TaxID=2661612 RepID=UPI000FEB87B6|nr:MULTISPECIES: flagellar hook-basal body complex protein [unclassified Pseudodesulfovibrio]MCJ2166252.1 flagellar hook-basal body complex protein [Pseudodesulfovibrio sp. S3-i]RWU02284.1 flagellar hook-basal body complex protein [Pseudodesulfovibrio sp. S3]